MGRDVDRVGMGRDRKISIHAPLMGRDIIPTPEVTRAERFQSTRPSWGATHRLRLRSGQRRISIHAPLMGRDFVTKIKLLGGR